MPSLPSLKVFHSEKRQGMLSHSLPKISNPAAHDPKASQSFTRKGYAASVKQQSC